MADKGLCRKCSFWHLFVRLFNVLSENFSRFQREKFNKMSSSKAELMPKPRLCRDFLHCLDKENNDLKFFNSILIAIIIVYILFKLFVITSSFHDLGWDESVYLGMGKYMYSHGNHGLWEEIRPPFLPLILGLFWKLKLPYVFLADLIMLLFSVSTILLTYICTKEILKQHPLFSGSQHLPEQYLELISIIPPLLLLSSELFLKQSYTIMTEIPAAFFILLSIYFYLKQKSPCIVGITTALAFMTKYTAGFIIPSLAMIIFFDNFIVGNKNKTESCKKLMYFILGNAIIITPFLIINGFLYQDKAGSWLFAVIYPIIKASIHQSNVIHAVSNPVINLLFYPLVLIKENMLFIFGLLGAIFYISNSIKYPLNKQEGIRFISLSSLLYLVYLTYIINKQPRFILLILPLLAIISAYALSSILKSILNKIELKPKLIIGSLLFLVFVLVGYSYWLQVTSNFYPFINEKPDIISQYYQYPTGYNISSPLLTTDPHFAAYNNQLFIPMYNNVDDAINIYAQYKTQVSAVIYDDAFYPCLTQSCTELKQELYENIINDFTLVYAYAKQPHQEILIYEDSVN